MGFPHATATRRLATCIVKARTRNAMAAASKVLADGEPPPRVILVVDDDVLIRLAIAEYLRECGFHVFEAADGAEAVTILNAAELAVDLVFSDVQMPRMDGFALAQ